LFSAGDTVVVRAYVVDTGTGLPVANATVDMTISGPEPDIPPLSGPSDNAGMVEVSWATTAPNRKGQGGTAPGSYSVTVTNVVAAGFNWDGVTTGTSFTIVE
jgi:hypothetical protein